MTDDIGGVVVDGTTSAYTHDRLDEIADASERTAISSHHIAFWVRFWSILAVTSFLLAAVVGVTVGIVGLLSS